MYLKHMSLCICICIDNVFTFWFVYAYVCKNAQVQFRFSPHSFNCRLYDPHSDSAWDPMCNSYILHQQENEENPNW